MFLLTEDHLLRLWRQNQFRLPVDRWIFFGLRGCLPVDDDDNSFSKSLAVTIETPDYVHPRCTLGQWQPGQGFALFAGSTVAHAKHVRSSSAQQLLTGCYADYRKGMHRAGESSGHEAFKQDNRLPVRRANEDDRAESDDRVDYEHPFDNLHSGWSPSVNHAGFASAGSQVVVGFPSCARRGHRPNTGAWRAFKENAYALEQTSFQYVLLTGRDAMRVAHASGPLAPRLRFGSTGPLVTLAQHALKRRGFYEGEIDEDFGIRTLRAVLGFQLAEFGSGADDAIIGPQTASALGVDWPKDSAPARARKRRRARGAPAVDRPRFDGDQALGPDGVVFAKRFKRGVYSLGQTSIEQFIRTGRAALGGISDSLLNVISVVSDNEGKLEAVNTWDDSFVTFGVFQWTLGRGNTRGELAALLAELQREHPARFTDLFGRYGLGVSDVRGGPPDNPGVIPVGFVTLDDRVLDRAETKEDLRTLDWAYRFWLAGHDDVVRAVQIQQAIGRLSTFYDSPRHRIDGRPIAAYVSSEACVALLLDQHVNRPGHVPKTLQQAVAALPNLPRDPANWGSEHERELRDVYIDLRSATSMTDSDKRAQRVLEAVSQGRISAERGSFVG